MRYQRNLKAFSLLELSISLLVLTTLLVFVAKGSQMLNKARVISAQSLTRSSPIPRISNLVVWYETTMKDSFSKKDVMSKTVKTWYNLNPIIKNNNATAGTAPSYKTKTINGLPAVVFNGNSQYLNYIGTALVQSDYTVFVVEQRSDNANSSYFMGGTATDSNSNLSLGYKSNTSLTFAQYSNDYDITVSGYMSPKPLIHTFRFSSAIGKNYYSNGVNKTLIASGSAASTTVLTSYAGAQIGRRLTTQYYNGSIGEIIIFNKYLNNDERVDVEKYLSKKWKIDLS